MRKTIGWLLALALMLPVGLAIANQDLPPLVGEEHLGNVSYATEEHSDGPIWDETTPEIAARLIMVQAFSEAAYEPNGVWLLVPEGEAREDYHGTAIRFLIEEDGYPEGALYATPASIEIVCMVAYGTVEEIGDDYLILTPFYGVEPTDGETARFTLTKDTVVLHKYEEGQTIEIVYDPDTLVIEQLNRANG